MNKAISVITRLAKAILDLFTSRPRLLFATSFASFVLIALPQRLQKFLGFDEIVQTYRGHIALVGVIALLFLVAWLLTKIAQLTTPWFARKWEDFRIHRGGHKVLLSLTREEKEHVAKYIAEDATSLSWMPENGIITILLQKAILFQASNVGRLFTGVEYGIQPWVEKVLAKHPDIKEEILKHYKG